MYFMSSTSSCEISRENCTLMETNYIFTASLAQVWFTCWYLWPGNLQCFEKSLKASLQLVVRVLEFVWLCMTVCWGEQHWLSQMAVKLDVGVERKVAKQRLLGWAEFDPVVEAPWELESKSAWGAISSADLSNINHLKKKTRFWFWLKSRQRSDKCILWIELSGKPKWRPFNFGYMT